MLIGKPYSLAGVYQTMSSFTEIAQDTELGSVLRLSSSLVQSWHWLLAVPQLPTDRVPGLPLEFLRRLLHDELASGFSLLPLLLSFDISSPII